VSLLWMADGEDDGVEARRRLGHEGRDLGSIL
jgi:hypothetical protein